MTNGSGGRVKLRKLRNALELPSSHANYEWGSVADLSMS